MSRLTCAVHDAGFAEIEAISRLPGVAVVRVVAEAERITRMPMSLRFEIFPSNLDATVDFYTRVLGFQVTVDRRGEPEPYVAVERDGVRIGAAYRPGPDHQESRRPPTGVELVLEVDDLEAALGRVKASGWPLVEELQSRPWGLRDFRILDASGYYLRITDRVIG